MDLKEIIDRNYKATVKRGLISNKTTFIDFFNKANDEFDELIESWIDHDLTIFDTMELADIILVCLAMAKHFNIDIQKALEDKTIFNEQRKD